VQRPIYSQAADRITAMSDNNTVTIALRQNHCQLASAEHS
jgi:hypothetical protein